jgi:hypothetical protein
MWIKLKQFALALLLINSVASANDISQLDGDWYSFKWKYGYSLSNGKGVAFATNSPNFKVGQEIVRLTAVGKNSFVGENVYKDGKFYKVKATLDQDGKLLFEGEKNVKWEMEKIDPETYSQIVNSRSDKHANKKDANPKKEENNSIDQLVKKLSKKVGPEGALSCSLLSIKAMVAFSGHSKGSDEEAMFYGFSKMVEVYSGIMKLLDVKESDPFFEYRVNWAKSIGVTDMGRYIEANCGHPEVFKLAEMGFK